MNKKLKHHLETAIRCAEAMLAEEPFHVTSSEINAVPVAVMTKTAAKKQGLVLKRGAKPVGTWEFRIATGGWGRGDLYLAESFKPKSTGDK